MTIENERGLLPCPFCGDAEPSFERMGTSGQSCIVVCENCGARHESSDEYLNSGRSWNERAALAALPQAPAPTAFEKTFPDHIWLDAGEAMEFAAASDTFRDLDGVTWSEDNASGYGVKYVRADLAAAAQATQGGADPAPGGFHVCVRHDFDLVEDLKVGCPKCNAAAVEPAQAAPTVAAVAQPAEAVSEEAIRDALQSQPWTPEHCKNYSRRAAEEIAFLRSALATPIEAQPASVERIKQAHLHLADMHEGYGRNHEKTMAARVAFYAELDALAAPAQAAQPAGAEPEEVEYGTKNPMLEGIQGELRIMMASAIAEGDDFVTGYRIKTGSIHRLIGSMQAAGYPVPLPALRQPAAPAQAAAVPEAVERDAARYQWLRSYCSAIDWNRLGHYGEVELDAQIDRLAAPEAGAGGGK